MALFKISKGNSTNLPAINNSNITNKVVGDGYCWFTYNDGKFYIDYTDPADNQLKRQALNAEQADKDSLGDILQNAYAADLNLNGHTLKLIAKNGSTVLTTITLPDELVRQTAKTDDAEYKILTTSSTSPTSGQTATVGYDTDITINPSTNTITAAEFNGNAKTVNNYYINAESYAYLGSLDLNIQCAGAVTNTGFTEAQIFALTGNRYGQLYLASDTNKYYRRKDTATDANSSHWRDDTSSVLASLNTTNYPNQLTSEDAVYIKIDLKNRYFASSPRFYIIANYDNINGTTLISGFSRAQNQFEMRAVSYNGNNLIGIYQPSSDTNIYYFKFIKYRSTFGPNDSYNMPIRIFYNYCSETPTITFINKNHNEYATVKAYSYISVPSYGIKNTNIHYTINPIANNSYTLGTSGARWKALYVGTANSYGSATQPIYWDAGVPKTVDLSVTDSTADNGLQYVYKVTQAAGGKITVSKSNIREASTSQSGIVTTDAQTFAGAKTFAGDTTLSGETTADSLTAGNLQVNGSTNFVNAPTIDSLTASQSVVTDANKKLISKDLTVSTATAETSTATTFVHSVTQDATGKITVKTRPLPTYNNYSLPLAANGTRGGIQIGYSESGTNYAVKLSSEKAYVTVPWTDTKVTSVGNHYAPSADSNAALSASASGATAAWSIDVVKAVQLQRDTKGHVTGVTVTSGKIPANPNTDYRVRQTNDASTDANYRLLLSNSANDTQEDQISRKNANLIYNPFTNKLSTGNIKLTGELDVTGNAYLRNQTTVDSLTAGSLIVNGSSTFNNSVTMTGILTAKASQYEDSYSGAINMNNSNIYGLNSIYTADASDTAAEGIHFYRDSTHVDTLWMNGGNIYFVPNRALGTSTTAANSEKVTRLPASITSGRAVYTDGTTGKLAVSAVTSTELGYLSGVTSAIQTQLNAKAPLASPELTGTPTAPTANAGTNTTQIATTAFVMNAFTANDAMVFKGVVNSNSDLPATHYQGWTYKVGTSGAYVGTYCEVGDMIICVTDGTSANNDHWAVIQVNIDGAVTGPASSTDNAIARFDGTTGKIIQDSKCLIDDNGTLTVGARVTTSLPSSETAINRLIITPYYHSGGPWYIKSSDSSSNAHLILSYGSSELLKIKHDGTFINSLKASITGNAATATEFSSNATVTLTGDTTGTSAGSKKSWSITTTTKFLSGTSESASALTTAPGTGKLKYSYCVSTGTTGLFASTNNANSIITFNRHEGNFNSQLGFSNNGNIYYRSFDNVALNTTTAWKQIAFTDSNITGNAATATKLASTPNNTTTFLRGDNTWSDTLTGDFNVNGNAIFNGETATDNLTAGNLQVNGNATFVNTINGSINGNAVTATTASKLSNTSKIGDTNKPVYFTASGVPIAINYTIDKSVPSNAVFTDRYVNSASFADDTTATAASPVKMTLTRAGSDTATVTANIPKVSSSSAGVAPKGAAVSSQSQSTKFLREDGIWAAPSYTTNTNTTYTIATGDANGQIKVTPSSGSAYNVDVKGLGTAAYTNATQYPIRSVYTIPAAKGVRITYPSYSPVLISVQRSSFQGRLILIGGGYGVGGTTRNDFTELVSSTEGSFTWSLPQSDSISASVEIMHHNTSGDATVEVWSKGACTFTEITALTTTKQNRTLLTSANYTDYTVTKTGTGATGTWGISISGTAAQATADASGNTITTTYLTKADGVTNVAWDNTNKKLTKTINGSTSDIVAVTVNNPTLAWNTESVIAKIGTVDVKVKLPANPNTNTDTLVKQTAKTDNVEYKILTTTSASPSSESAAEAAYDTGVTINPSTHTVTATTYKVTTNASITYNASNGCLEIIA